MLPIFITILFILLADEVHYNAAGAEFIATRYYDTLINVLVE